LYWNELKSDPLVVCANIHRILTMDIIESCLSLTPVPCLGLAFSVFRTIWTLSQEVQASKEQLLVLAYSTGQLLNVLDSRYRARKLLEDRTEGPLHELSRYDMHCLRFPLVFHLHAQAPQ
jgi:hypothetical protein